MWCLENTSGQWRESSTQPTLDKTGGMHSTGLFQGSMIQTSSSGVSTHSKSFSLYRSSMIQQDVAYRLLHLKTFSGYTRNDWSNSFFAYGLALLCNRRFKWKNRSWKYRLLFPCQTKNQQEPEEDVNHSRLSSQVGMTGDTLSRSTFDVKIFEADSTPQPHPRLIISLLFD